MDRIGGQRIFVHDRLSFRVERSDEASSVAVPSHHHNACGGDLRDEINEHRQACGDRVSPPRVQADQDNNDLRRRLDELRRAVDGRINFNHNVRIPEPFTRQIMDALLPRGYKPCNIEVYRGKTCPQHHVSRYMTYMVMMEYNDVIRCR
ncbi:unnamed protein product [Cuscuta europaea]|uniref:Uncharacterized protein n=1 Tax=Cuscuta europaea TaxID=41803 RepID=A0A9P0YP03_CUSEU|nr:unnamed protein product [Cuscuta europaea]